MGTNSGNFLLDTLPPPQRASLIESSEHRRLPVGTLIYAQNGPMDEVIFLTSGLASHVLLLSDGTTGEASVTGKGEVVGLPAWLGDSTSHTETSMQVAGEGFVLPTRIFLQTAAAHPELRVCLLEQAAQTIRMLSQTVVCNVEHRATPRLARWLRSVQVRLGADDFTLTHEFLSQMTGVRRPTATLSALELRDAGLIEYRRARIHVNDGDALAAAACECGAEIDRPYLPLH